jgi:hypothetical protein
VLASKRFSLALALQDRTLLNVRGPFDWHETNGYAVRLGDEWALFQLVDRCGGEDGFAAIRLETIAEIAPVSSDDSFLAGRAAEAADRGSLSGRRSRGRA